MRLNRTLIIVILAGAMAAGVVLRLAMTTPASITTATLLTNGDALPEIDLVDHHGESITAASFRGQWDLVFFGFTNCPDVCPITLQVLATAVRRLEEDGVEPVPRIVFISVDPERDTLEKMGEYVGHFGERTLGVTGPLENIKVLTSALGIFFEKQAVDGDNYSVDHSAAVLVINPKGKFHAVFGGRHDVANFVNDLPVIMADTL